jgi:hypothetical protein
MLILRIIDLIVSGHNEVIDSIRQAMRCRMVPAPKYPVGVVIWAKGTDVVPVE